MSDTLQTENSPRFYDGGLRFSCKECGACCSKDPGDIWVSEAEIQQIAQYLKISVKELTLLCLREDMCGNKSIKDLPERNYDCIFQDAKTRRCKIYPVRPKQCAQFPFWKSMLENKAEWDFYAKRCPGMNNGRLYTKEEIEKAAGLEP